MDLWSNDFDISLHLDAHLLDPLYYHQIQEVYMEAGSWHTPRFPGGAYFHVAKFKGYTQKQDLGIPLIFRDGHISISLTRRSPYA